MRDPPDDGGGRAEAQRGSDWSVTSQESNGESRETSDEEPFDGAFAGDPTVLLLMADDRNRELLGQALADEAEVVATTSVDDCERFDLCLVSHERFVRVRESLLQRVESAEPTFLPVVLLVRENQTVSSSELEAVDEIVEMPVSKATLRVRLENLLTRRRQSEQLVTRETELDATVARLQVRERALDEAPIGITIGGPREADTPLVYINDAFVDLTGYERDEVLGRNCRFLQGERTDDVTTAKLRRAIEQAEPVSVDIVNYTRDGERFWNKLDIAPVRNQLGEVTHFVGFQTDITARKLHEQRLQVLNRLMRHDLRNQLNVIDGYAEALASGSVGEEEAVGRIRDAVGRLVKLSGETTHIEHVFSGDSGPARLHAVAEIIEDVRTELVARHPSVTVEVEGFDGDESVYLSARTLALGCVDYLSMLVDANERSEPAVSVVASHDERSESVRIELADNDGGLDTADWDVIEAGVETPLHHTDRLGLWTLQWAATTTGGEIIRSETSDGTLVLQCPVKPAPDAQGADGDTDATDDDGA